MTAAAERAIAIAVELVAARARAAELEAELAGLVDGPDRTRRPALEVLPPTAPPPPDAAPAAESPTEDRDLYRNVVVLAKEDHAPKEIAALLGIGTPYVHTLMYRARKRGDLPPTGKSKK